MHSGKMNIRHLFRYGQLQHHFQKQQLQSQELKSGRASATAMTTVITALLSKTTTAVART